MKITNEWLKEQLACVYGYKWSQRQTDRELKPFIDALLKNDHWDWANWVVTHAMTHAQKIQYAVFAAEQVIKIYEDKYPDDNRPRKAIEAAKEYLKNPSNAATKAAKAANDAAANAAANAATYATYATYAANAATYATYATYAAYAAKDKMRLTIITHGVDLLEKGRVGE